MALRDSRGRITIDEVAANKDISRVLQARESLDDSRRTIESIISQASSEQGQMATAIVEKATELNNQIKDMIRRLDETSSFINRTVDHYREVDRMVKEAIENKKIDS